MLPVILARWSLIFVKLLICLLYLLSNSVLYSTKLPIKPYNQDLFDSTLNSAKELESIGKVRNLTMSDIFKDPLDDRGLSSQEDETTGLVKQGPNFPDGDTKYDSVLINNKHDLVTVDFPPEQEINGQSKRRRHSVHGTEDVKAQLSKQRRRRKLVSHKRRKLSAESLPSSNFSSNTLLNKGVANSGNSSCLTKGAAGNLSNSEEILNFRSSTSWPVSQENKSSSLSPTDENKKEVFEKDNFINTTLRERTTVCVLKNQNSINPSDKSIEIGSVSTSNSICTSSPKFSNTSFSTSQNFRGNASFLKSVHNFSRTFEVSNYPKDYLKKLFPAVSFGFPSNKVNHSKVCETTSWAPSNATESAIRTSQNYSVLRERNSTIAMSSSTKVLKVKEGNSSHSSTVKDNSNNVSCENLSLQNTSISLRNNSTGISSNSSRTVSTASLCGEDVVNFTTQATNSGIKSDKFSKNQCDSPVVAVVENKNDSALSNSTVSDDHTSESLFELLDSVQKKGQLLIDLHNTSLGIPISDAVRNKTLKVDHSPFANVSFVLLENSGNKSTVNSSRSKALNLTEVSNSSHNVNNYSQSLNNAENINISDNGLSGSLLNSKIDPHETCKLWKFGSRRCKCMQDVIDKPQGTNSEYLEKVNKTKKPSEPCIKTICSCFPVDKTKTTAHSTVETGAPNRYSNSTNKSGYENKTLTINKSSVTIKSTAVSSCLNSTEQGIKEKATLTPNPTEAAFDDTEKICQAKLEFLQLVKKLILNGTCKDYGLLEKINVSKPLKGKNAKNLNVSSPLTESKGRILDNERTVNLTREFIDNTVNAFNIVTKLPFFIDHAPSVNDETEPKPLFDQTNVVPNKDRGKFALKVFMDGRELYNDVVTGDSRHLIKLDQVADSSKQKIGLPSSKTSVAPKQKILTWMGNVNRQKTYHPKVTDFEAFQNPAKKTNIFKRVKGRLLNFGKAKLNSVKNYSLKHAPPVFTGESNGSHGYREEKSQEIEPTHAFIQRRLKCYYEANKAVSSDVDLESNQENQTFVRNVIKTKRSNGLSKIKTNGTSPFSQDSVAALLTSLANISEYSSLESNSVSSTSLPSLNSTEVLNVDSRSRNMSLLVTPSSDFNDTTNPPSPKKSGSEPFSSNTGLISTLLRHTLSQPLAQALNYVNVSDNLKHSNPHKSKPTFFLVYPEVNVTRHESKLTKMSGEGLNVKKFQPNRLLAVIINPAENATDIPREFRKIKFFSLNGNASELLDLQTSKLEEGFLPIVSFNIDSTSNENSTVLSISKPLNLVNGSLKNDSLNSAKPDVKPSPPKTPITNPDFNMFNSSSKPSVVSNKSSDYTNPKKNSSKDENEQKGLIPVDTHFNALLLLHSENNGVMNSSIILIQNTNILRIPLFSFQIHNSSDKDPYLNLSVTSIAVSPQILSNISSNSSVVKSFGEFANAGRDTLQNLRNIFLKKIENSSTLSIVNATSSSISDVRSLKMPKNISQNVSLVNKATSEGGKNNTIINGKSSLSVSTENTIFPVRSHSIASNLTNGEFHSGKETFPKLKAEVKSKIEFLTPVVLLNRSSSTETNFWTDTPSEKRAIEEAPEPTTINVSSSLSRNTSSSIIDSFAQVTEKLPTLSFDFKSKPCIDDKKSNEFALKLRKSQELNAYSVSLLFINDTKHSQSHLTKHSNKSDGVVFDHFLVLAQTNGSKSSFRPYDSFKSYSELSYQNSQPISFLNIPFDFINRLYIRNLSAPAALVSTKIKNSNLTETKSLLPTILEDKQGVSQFTDDGSKYIASQVNEHHVSDSIASHKNLYCKKNSSLAELNSSKPSVNVNSRKNVANISHVSSAVTKVNMSSKKLLIHHPTLPSETGKTKNLIKSSNTMLSNTASMSSNSVNHTSGSPIQMEVAKVSNSSSNLDSKQVSFSSSTAQHNIFKPSKHNLEGKIIVTTVKSQSQDGLHSPKVSDNSPSPINYSEEIGKNETNDKNHLKFLGSQFVKQNNSVQLPLDKKNGLGHSSVSFQRNNVTDLSQNHSKSVGKSQNREGKIPRQNYPKTKIEIPVTSNFLVKKSKILAVTAPEDLSTDSPNSKLHPKMNVEDVGAELPSISEPSNLNFIPANHLPSADSINLNQLKSNVSLGMISMKPGHADENLNPTPDTSRLPLEDSVLPADETEVNIETTASPKDSTYKISVNSAHVNEATEMPSTAEELTSGSASIDGFEHNRFFLNSPASPDTLSLPPDSFRKKIIAAGHPAFLAVPSNLMRSADKSFPSPNYEVTSVPTSYPSNFDSYLSATTSVNQRDLFHLQNNINRWQNHDVKMTSSSYQGVAINDIIKDILKWNDRQGFPATRNPYTNAMEIIKKNGASKELKHYYRTHDSEQSVLGTKSTPFLRRMSPDLDGNFYSSSSTAGKVFPEQPFMRLMSATDREINADFLPVDKVFGKFYPASPSRTFLPATNKNRFQGKNRPQLLQRSILPFNSGGTPIILVFNSYHNHNCTHTVSSPNQNYIDSNKKMMMVPVNTSAFLNELLKFSNLTKTDVLKPQRRKQNKCLGDLLNENNSLNLLVNLTSLKVHNTEEILPNFTSYQRGTTCVCSRLRNYDDNHQQFGGGVAGEVESPPYSAQAELLSSNSPFGSDPTDPNSSFLILNPTLNQTLFSFLESPQSENLPVYFPDDNIFASNFIANAKPLSPTFSVHNSAKSNAFLLNQSFPLNDFISLNYPVLDHSSFAFVSPVNRTFIDSTTPVDVKHQATAASPDSYNPSNVTPINTPKIMSYDSSSKNIGINASARKFVSNEDQIRNLVEMDKEPSSENALSNSATSSSKIDGTVVHQSDHGSKEKNLSSPGSFAESSVSSEALKDSHSSKNAFKTDSLSGEKKIGVEYQFVQPPVIILSSSLKSASKKLPLKIFQANKAKSSNFERKPQSSFKVQTSSSPIRILNPLIVIAGAGSNTEKDPVASSTFKFAAPRSKKSKKLMNLCLNLRPSKKNCTRAEISGLKEVPNFIGNQSTVNRHSTTTENDSETAACLASSDFLQSDAHSRFTPLINEITSIRSDILFYPKRPFQKSNEEHLPQSSVTVSESANPSFSSHPNGENSDQTLLNKLSEPKNLFRSKTITNNKNLESAKKNTSGKFFTPMYFQMTANIDWPDEKLMKKVSDKPVVIKFLFQNVSGAAVNTRGKYKPKSKPHRGLKRSHQRMYSYFTGSSKKKSNFHFDRNHRSEESEKSGLSESLPDLSDSPAGLNHDVSFSSDESAEIPENRIEFIEKSKIGNAGNSVIIEMWNTSSKSSAESRKSLLDSKHLETSRDRYKETRARIVKQLGRKQPSKYHRRYSQSQTASKTILDDHQSLVSPFQRKLKSYEYNENDGLNDYSDYGLKSSLKGDVFESQNITDFPQNLNSSHSLDVISDNESKSDLCPNVSNLSVSLKKELDHFSELLLSILKKCQSSENQSAVAFTKSSQENRILSKRQFLAASPNFLSKLTTPALNSKVKYPGPSLSPRFDSLSLSSNNAADSKVESTPLIPAAIENVHYFSSTVYQTRPGSEFVRQNVVSPVISSLGVVTPSLARNILSQNNAISSILSPRNYSPSNSFFSRLVPQKCSSTNARKNDNFNRHSIAADNEYWFSLSPYQIGFPQEQNLNWFVPSDQNLKRNKNLIFKWVQKLLENSTEAVKRTQFSANDCKTTYNTNCVCDMSKVLSDYDRIICERSSSEESRVHKILDYQCGAYLPLPIGYNISSDSKSRVLTSKKKQMISDSKDGPKEIDPAGLKYLLNVGASSVENSLLHAFAGSKIAIPCFNDSKISLPTGATDGTQYTWQKEGKIITDGRMKELPEGMLIIENVALADIGSFLCTVSLMSPENSSHEKRIFNHTLSVVTVPKIIIQALIHYKVNAECNSEILEVLNLYLPQLIQESVCDIGEENNDVCLIDVYNPLCFKNNTDGTIISVNIQMDVKGIDYLIIGGYANKTLCSPVCHQKLYLKTSLILRESLHEALLNPIFGRTSLTGADFIPMPASLDLKMTIGCNAGFHQVEQFCVPCPPHSFSNEGSTQCDKCPTGSYQPQLGSRACLPCPSMFTPGCNIINNIFDKRKKQGSADKNVTHPAEIPSSGSRFKKFLARLSLIALLGLFVYWCIRSISRYFSHKNWKTISQKIIPVKRGGKDYKKIKPRRTSRKKKITEEIELQELKPPGLINSDGSTEFAETEFGHSEGTKTYDSSSSGEEPNIVNEKQQKPEKDKKRRSTEIRNWAQAHRSKDSPGNHEFIELQELKPSGEKRESVKRMKSKAVKDVQKRTEEIKKWTQGQKLKLSPGNHEYIELQEFHPMKKENSVQRNGRNFVKGRSVDKSVQTPERKKKPALPQPDFT